MFFKMKRLLLIVLFVTSALVVHAQPRAIGLGVGVTELDVSYQHSFFKNQFLQADLGMDYGFLAAGHKASPGVQATVTYNFVWARPAWTNKGSWAIYAGPGVSMGWVEDELTVVVGPDRRRMYDYGFMLAAAVQVGIEYTFEFPLQLALNVRPFVGFHINDRYVTYPGTDIEISYPNNFAFYDNGMMGFIPTLSIRYRF